MVSTVSIGFLDVENIIILTEKSTFRVSYYSVHCQLCKAGRVLTRKAHISVGKQNVFGAGQSVSEPGSGPDWPLVASDSLVPREIGQRPNTFCFATDIYTLRVKTLPAMHNWQCTE